MRTSLWLTLLAITFLTACSGNRPQQLLAGENQFVECPSSPNCVSSDSQSDSHRIDAFSINGNAPDLWQKVKATVQSMPRTELVADKDGYLHAECTSAIMRYVDDLQLQLRADQGIIAVYSASRLGHSDFGVNRERVEQLREQLLQANLITNP